VIYGIGRRIVGVVAIEQGLRVERFVPREFDSCFSSKMAGSKHQDNIERRYIAKSDGFQKISIIEFKSGQKSAITGTDNDWKGKKNTNVPRWQ
jgi:hypothetical protein